MTEESFKLVNQNDLIEVRMVARQLCAEAGFNVMDQTRFTTAVSEIGRNAIVYARGGVATIQDLSDADYLRVEAKIIDQGPGIPNLEEAMQDGYSTGNGLGAGLPGTKRLVSHFNIESTSQGTTVIFQVVRKRL